jgi:ABC-type enterochelin transport system permease subunit
MLKAPQWNALLIPLVDNSKSSPIDPTKVMTGFESLKQFLYNNLASPLIGYDNTEKATWPLLLLSSVLSALFITMSFVMRYVFTPNTFDLVKGKNQSARDYFY